MVNLYIGNLPYQASEEELRAMFQQHGTVERVSVIVDRMTGRSKGFGFVEMTNDAEAKTAIAELNETEFKGRNILVNEARPQTDRPRRAPRRENQW